MVKFGRKFFFDTKHSKKRRIITYIIAGILLILLIVIIALIIRGINKKKPKTPKAVKTAVILRKEVPAEINEPLPDKTAYFEKLENFDINKITIKYPDYLPLAEAYDNCNDDELKILEEIKNGKPASDYENPYACVGYSPTGIGAYDVTVNYDNKDYTVTLNVVDSKAPTLVVTNKEITEGDTYSISDFVESCVDNSKKDCSYEYYYKDYNSDIDYSKLTAAGTYTVSIVALDGSGNTTVPEDATLIIKEKPQIKVFAVNFNSDGGSSINTQYVNENEKASNPKAPTKSGYSFAGWYKDGSKFDFNTPITGDITLTAKWNKNASPKPNNPTCSNGDLKYDSSKYKYVAVYVSNGNCAISKSDLNLKTFGVKATSMVETEKAKLKKWQDANGYDYYWVLIGDAPQGVLNTSGKGYVGYTIQFSIAKKENGNYIEIARYYLDKNGHRKFSLNNVNLPES